MLTAATERSGSGGGAGFGSTFFGGSAVGGFAATGIALRRASRPLVPTATSPQNYKASTVVGRPFSKQQVTTTPRGYKVTIGVDTN